MKGCHLLVRSTYLSELVLAGYNLASLFSPNLKRICKSGWVGRGFSAGKPKSRLVAPLAIITRFGLGSDGFPGESTDLQVPKSWFCLQAAASLWIGRPLHSFLLVHRAVVVFLVLVIGAIFESALKSFPNQVYLTRTHR